jgi:hypothetical protein
MVVAAAIAMALGGLREASRLKQRRDTCLMRATWHAEAEAYHRRLSVRPPTRTDLRVEADQEPTPSPPPSAELDQVIEQEFGLPAERSIRSEEHDRSEGHDRFREAQARQSALADRISKLVDAHRRKQSEYHAKQAEYHAALARRYRDAVSRPWLEIGPDPPLPEP